MPIDRGTIAAIATAPGEAGIAVIRVSGPETIEIIERSIRTGSGRNPLRLTGDHSHSITYGYAIDPVSGHGIDEVMVAWMAAPRSFTTEDTAEVSCHGGAMASNLVLRAILAAGARPAEPGEFTLRAFLNGRIGLTEAEAVLGVVSAHTSDALEQALSDLRGDMARRIAPAREAIVAALAYLDASADFPDDEIEVSNVAADLALAQTALESIVAGARSGRLLSDGATVALIGRPNVGKSSLLNALLRSDRAIVTPIAGTTRDVINERAVLDGIPVTLLDTAGIADTVDLIEQAGIARSRTAMDRASGLVLVMDGSEPLHQDDLGLLADISARFDTGALGDSPVVAVINKCDLGLVTDLDLVRSLLPDGAKLVIVSAQTGDGIAELEQAIADRLRGNLASEARPSMLSARQYAELDRALLHIRAAREAHAVGFPTDVLATDVRAASRAIGNVTGEDIDEAILVEIFSRFCIGK